MTTYCCECGEEASWDKNCDCNCGFDGKNLNQAKKSKFDPNGSYTGNPIGDNKPVQDADDL